MKVLFVLDSLGPGGAERSTAALLPHLRAQGIQVSVATLRRAAEGSEDEVREAGVTLHELTSRTLVGRIRELRLLLRREAFDVIHTALFDADVAGRFAALATRTKVVSSLTSVPRGQRRAGRRSWKVWTVDLVDVLTARAARAHLHAVTEGVALLTATAHPLLRGRITVVERGRDRSVLGVRSLERRTVVRRELGIDHDVPMLLAVGRQVHEKGHVSLIRAMPAVLHRHPDASLLIAGRSGPATGNIEAALAADPQSARAVRLLGHRDDVADLLVAADVMLVSSRHEGAAGVVLEAMALGTPVVSTRLDGLVGVLEHERNALLVPVGDSEAMATAIDRLLTEPGLAAQLSEAGKHDFEERFRVERSAASMVALYRSLMGEPEVVSRAGSRDSIEDG